MYVNSRVPDYVTNSFHGCLNIFHYWKWLYSINTCSQAERNTWSLLMMKLLTFNSHLSSLQSIWRLNPDFGWSIGISAYLRIQSVKHEANNNQVVQELNSTESDFDMHHIVLHFKSHPLFSVASQTLTAFCGMSSHQTALKMFSDGVRKLQDVTQLFNPNHKGLNTDHREEL